MTHRDYLDAPCASTSASPTRRTPPPGQTGPSRPILYSRGVDLKLLAHAIRLATVGVLAARSTHHPWNPSTPSAITARSSSLSPQDLEPAYIAYALRGFVTCGQCNKPLTGSWSQSKTRRRYAYYHCPPKARCRCTNIPRHELEAKFLSLLENLRPRPELVALFRRVVLDVWETRRQDIEAQRTAAERKIVELKRRKDQLLDAFIYQRVIDQETYKDQLDKLNEGMTLAEMEQHGQRSEELDLEAVLAFAEKVSLSASRMWLEADLEQRQRLQALLFPEGLQLMNGEIRTPVSASFYNELGSFLPSEERLVFPAGASSNRRSMADFVRRMHALRRFEWAA
jgi:hypothetical protein